MATESGAWLQHSRPSLPTSLSNNTPLPATDPHAISLVPSFVPGLAWGSAPLEQRSLRLADEKALATALTTSSASATPTATAHSPTETQWEHDWGVAQLGSQWQQHQQAANPRPREQQQNADGSTLAHHLLLSGNDGSLSLSPQPTTFLHRLAAAHCHLFLPLSYTPLPPSAALFTTCWTQGVALDLVRSCALVLQCVPSALFPLSVDSSSSPSYFQLGFAAVERPLLPSAVRLLNEFAHCGSLLLSIERLAEALSAAESSMRMDSAISVGLCSALRFFCSHHKRQVESLLKRDGASVTVMQLHVFTCPLVAQVEWLHRLLQSLASHTSAPAPSPVAPTSSYWLPSIAASVDTLSHLHLAALSLSISSPFYATLAFLLHSALTPYLRLLSLHVSCPTLQPVQQQNQQPHQQEQAVSSYGWRVPSFLSSEAELIDSAAAVLVVTERAGGTRWTVGEGGPGGTGGEALVFRVGWTVQDAHRMDAALRMRERSQNAQLTTHMAQVAAKREAEAQQLAQRRAAIRRHESQRWLVEQQGTAQSISSAASLRRDKQAEYAAALTEQLVDKKRRQEESREVDRADSERAIADERRRREIVDEEKVRLAVAIQAVQQGRSEADVRRDEWQKKRRTHSEQLLAVIREDERVQQLETEQLQSEPHPEQQHRDPLVEPPEHTIDSSLLPEQMEQRVSEDGGKEDLEHETPNMEKMLNPNSPTTSSLASLSPTTTATPSSPATAATATAPEMTTPATSPANDPQHSPTPIAAPAPSPPTAANGGHALPISVAIRSTLIRSLRQQCFFVQRASLAFFLHSLRIDQHFLTLQNCLLFRAQATMGAFTDALFQTLYRSKVAPPATAIESHSLQSMWSESVRTFPPSTDAARILPVVVVSPPSPSTGAFSGLDAFGVIDSIRLHYTAPPAISHLMRPTAMAAYGRVFTLLMRLAYASSEVRRLYSVLRLRDAQLHRELSELNSAARASLKSSRTHRGRRPTATAASTRRPLTTAAANDDSLLPSPTRRMRVQHPPTSSSTSSSSTFSSQLLFSPNATSSSTATRDDDSYLTDRRAADAARRALHRSVQQRWRLRWLHATRAEMQHTLGCLNQHVHQTVIGRHTESFMGRIRHAANTVSDSSHPSAVSSILELERLHAAFIEHISATLHVNQQSQLAALIEAILASSVAIAQAAIALPAEDSDQDDGEEQERVESWQTLRDLQRQFRSHALLLSRLLQVAVSEGMGDGVRLLVGTDGGTGDNGIAQLQCAFDFNGYYAKRRQLELEQRLLAYK